jgi:hypothetical protein
VNQPGDSSDEQPRSEDPRPRGIQAFHPLTIHGGTFATSINSQTQLDRSVLPRCLCQRSRLGWVRYYLEASTSQRIKRTTGNVQIVMRALIWGV